MGGRGIEKKTAWENILLKKHWFSTIHVEGALLGIISILMKTSYITLWKQFSTMAAAPFSKIMIPEMCVF